MNDTNTIKNTADALKQVFDMGSNFADILIATTVIILMVAVIQYVIVGRKGGESRKHTNQLLIAGICILTLAIPLKILALLQHIETLSLTGENSIISILLWPSTVLLIYICAYSRTKMEKDEASNILEDED